MLGIFVRRTLFVLMLGILPVLLYELVAEVIHRVM